MDPDEKLLGDLQAWARAKYGRSALLARKLGVSRQLVSHWITGRRTPTLHDGLLLQEFLEKGGNPRKEKRVTLKMNDLRQLILTALRFPAARSLALNPRPPDAGAGSEQCPPQLRYSKTMIALSGFEIAIVMWATYRRHQMVMAKIRRFKSKE